jgi:hypothetical protein
VVLIGDFACLVRERPLRDCLERNVEALSEEFGCRGHWDAETALLRACCPRRIFYNSIQRRNTLVLLHLHENAKNDEYDWLLFKPRCFAVTRC